jgi:DMSO/TMAO reductase YedYZ molybdopterin-dependent catalytic subunit
MAGGLSSLVWARPFWRFVSPATDVLPASVRQVLPAGGWRIYTVAATMPVFNPATWRLKIDGLVERPLELTYADLRALPRAEQVSDFHCVTGWSVKNVHWGGVRFRDLLAAAKPLPAAKALAFVSAEQPYVDSLTLEQAYLKDAMLAYEMDGQPLPRPHGAPARVVIPEMYGYKNTKWVERIVVTNRPVDGYWELRGYDRNAWVGHSNGHHGSA